jgi:hypothetical protein
MTLYAGKSGWLGGLFVAVCDLHQWLKSTRFTTIHGLALVEVLDLSGIAQSSFYRGSPDYSKLREVISVCIPGVSQGLFQALGWKIIRWV